MKKLTLDPGAASLLDALHRAGYAAYAVGGCVRDSLLGQCPHDWDLCTSALPQQVMDLFGAAQCIPTGLQHGTVTVKRDGGLYEITTFRTEGTYSDGRHPDSVQFVPEVREDLARRDFTINAMAYNETEGLVDPFGGQEDLAAGIVRAVGVPYQRFEEDALRILRLYRFAARFGFAIDPPTGQAAEELCAHLDCVSVERIAEELAKLLAAPAPADYLNGKILGVILPELSADALEAAKPVLNACPTGTEHLPVRLAALLYSLGEAGTRKVLKRLRYSNALIEETAVLVRESGAEAQSRWELSPRTARNPRFRPTVSQRGPTSRSFAGETPNVSGPITSAEPGGRAGSFSEDRPLGWDPVAEGNRAGDGMARFVSEEKAPSSPDQFTFTICTRKLLGKYDLKTVQRLAALGTAMEPEHAEDFAALAQLAEQLDANGVCCRVSQLVVNGRDLMAAGIPAGPKLRQVLEALLDAVIREQLPNEREALLHEARKFSAP